MAFHQARFPIDIALGARGGPRRITDIVPLVSGHEERNSRWLHSRRYFDAGYGVKTRADLQTVLAFFEERRGRFHSFLWRDGLDHSSAAAGQPVSALDQALGVGDGETTVFQLTKRYGAAFDPYDRQITKPVAATVLIAVDGTSLASADFDVDDMSGEVTFDAAPDEGAVLTAGFEFDVPVRFDTDRLDVELSSFDAAQVLSIPVIEVRE